MHFSPTSTSHMIQNPELRSVDGQPAKAPCRRPRTRGRRVVFFVNLSLGKSSRKHAFTYIDVGEH